jgi:hypothetical protein
LSAAAGQAAPRSLLLAADLLGLLGAVESTAEKLIDAAYEDAEPGLAYAARIVRDRAAESRELLEKVLHAHTG